ncbi:Fic family protein [Hymenobacter negativus]|uniref:Fic family protein n=1 Tax=Hymenobacter negativus TaxID=2795026 RepID=A0ABS3QLG1_9BACT|nr:Fic family protein [Hymenobacter negativus]MBO2011515.1 Fic family protein [Hymenobacter negativus]
MPDFAAITRLKATLDASGPLTAEQAQQAQVAWTFHAGSVGHTLTLPETDALLRHGLTAAGKPWHEQLALRQHHAAVQHLETVARSAQALTEEVIGELHALLLGLPASTRSAYKTQPNDVLTAAGTVRYCARPDDVPARLADLLAWYQRATTQHPVAVAATFHHRFLRISPFEVGNGRLARLLLGLVLRRHGYPAALIKPTDWERYQAALAAADVGEPEALQRFVAEAVATTLRQQLRAAKGEPGYDPDDLQTKLALLKQQVLTREDAVATLWNQELQATVYDVLLRPWLTNAQLQTQGFDELFMSRGYSGGVAAAGAPPLVLEEEGDWYAFEALLMAAVVGTRAEIETVRFAKKWLHFRQRHNGFDVGVTVAFHFYPDHFTVRHTLFSQRSTAGPEANWQEEVFSSAYLPSYEHAHFHEINHQLASRLYDFVAARLATSDAVFTS